MSESKPSLDKPLVTLKPRTAWTALDLHELWSYRELLYFLTWRDIKVRYKQSLLGAMWAIIQPLSRNDYSHGFLRQTGRHRQPHRRNSMSSLCVFRSVAMNIFPFGRSQLHLRALRLSIVISIAVLIYSAYAFQTTEKSFADIG